MKNDKSDRVYRGGSWYGGARSSARVAYRSEFNPSCRDDSLGFRLARIVSPLKQLSEVIHEQ